MTDVRAFIQDRGQIAIDALGQLDEDAATAYQYLLDQVCDEEIIRRNLEEFTNYKTGFEEWWRRFQTRQQFCGALATISPNTATEESDFSITGWERVEYRQSTTDFSLEGTLHAKQFELVSALATKPELERQHDRLL